MQGLHILLILLCSWLITLSLLYIPFNTYSVNRNNECLRLVLVWTWILCRASIPALSRRTGCHRGRPSFMVLVASTSPCRWPSLSPSSSWTDPHWTPLPISSLSLSRAFHVVSFIIFIDIQSTYTRSWVTCCALSDYNVHVYRKPF